jgi:hypothetical protein
MSISAPTQWYNATPVMSRKWTCGHCQAVVAGALGFRQVSAVEKTIHLCPHCDKPTIFLEGGTQVPGVPYGADVPHLPEAVSGLYREARNCMTVAAYTASVLATRKLLMNVAVSQGAAGGEHFHVYVTFLSDRGYVPPNAKVWVDHIRLKGNEATHEIPPITRADAEDLLSFMEMILKLVFEYPNRVPGHGPPPPAP